MQRALDYLILDIDGTEWSIFESMINQNSLSHVKQLIVTIHTKEKHGLATTVLDFYNYWTALHELENQGFVRWSFVADSDGQYFSKRTQLTQTCCYKIMFLNLNYVDRLVKWLFLDCVWVVTQ